MTRHQLLRLQGNTLEPIGCSPVGVQFDPREGMLRRCGGLFAVSATEIQPGVTVLVRLVKVPDSDEAQPVVVQTDGQPERELVLVQEYSPGCGAKRWPAFRVEFGPEVRILRQDSTAGGSGGESWTLVSAPLGWAANIAGQFRNERDIGSQTIAYRPGWVPPVVQAEPEEPERRTANPPTHTARRESVSLNASAWGALDALKF